MATKTARKKPHKFKHKKVVKKKHKATRRRETELKAQIGTEKQQGEIQEGIVAAPIPVVATGFPKPYEPTPQGDTVVTPQPQQAKVESVQPEQITKPITESSTPSESPKPQTVSPEQTSAKPVGDVASPLGDTEPPPKKSKLWVVILVFVVILSIGGGGLYYFREEFILKTAEEEKKSKTPIPTPSEVSPTPKLEEEEATTSADVEVDPTEYSIKVLNGSGIAGEAAKVRDILEEASFIVEDIGNAESSDYTKTIIQAKAHISKEYLDLLREELGKVYLLDKTQELEEEEDIDVMVVVGKEEV